MMREDATALVNALQDLLRCRPADSFERQRNDGVRAIFAESQPAGEWAVVVHWAQGPYERGMRIRHLAALWPRGTGTVAEAAEEIWLFSILEPHGAEGEQDAEGRYWLAGWS